MPSADLGSAPAFFRGAKDAAGRRQREASWRLGENGPGMVLEMVDEWFMGG